MTRTAFIRVAGLLERLVRPNPGRFADVQLDPDFPE
jgi:hypothetical protein